MAIGFATLTVLLWQSDKKVLAGFFGGLMLLSGPSAVFGLIVLGIAGVGALAGRMETLAFIRDRDTMRPFLFGMLLALGIVGTMFLRYPQGLSAMLQAVPDAFAGWTTGGIWGVCTDLTGQHGFVHLPAAGGVVCRNCDI